MDKSARKDLLAFNLFLAAVPLEAILDQTGLPDITELQAAIQRVLKKREESRTNTPIEIELERLDQLYRAIYPRALKGDTASIDRCLSISSERLRLTGERHGGGMLEAFDKTIASLSTVDTTGLDSAAIEAGRTLARQIDAAIRSGTGQDVTKALYLVPHLMNVLKELGATPTSRSPNGAQ